MDTTEKGIFINGKQQIIEMLQFMENDDKQKLLENIKQRNAPMAKELSEKSLSFKDLFRLSSGHIRTIFEKSNPAIIGLALYPLTVSLQKKALQSLSREVAEQAFNVMRQDLSHKKIECQRAQEKIVRLAIQLSRHNSVQL